MTGVGGVTNVVGGSWRFCGVEGRVVLIGSCLGVTGPPCLRSWEVSGLLLLWTSSLAGSDDDVSFSSDTAVFTLFLLLDDLKMPTKPPPPPPPSVLIGSVSPPDFLRGRVQELRSLPLGDGLRSGSEMEEVLLGSTMRGSWMSVVGSSAAGNASVEACTSATWLVWAFISGDDRVKYPWWDWRGSNDGLLRVLSL